MALMRTGRKKQGKGTRSVRIQYYASRRMRQRTAWKRPAGVGRSRLQHAPSCRLDTPSLRACFVEDGVVDCGEGRRMAPPGGRIPPEPYCRAVSSHVTPKLPGISGRFRRIVRPSAIMRMVLHGNAGKCHVGDDLGGTGAVFRRPCVFMHNRALPSVLVCVLVTFNALPKTAEFQRFREGVPVPGNFGSTWLGTEAAATRPGRGIS